MSTKIYVPAIDGWDFFEDNLGKLKESSVEIASASGVSVYMTEHAGLPLLTVECLGVEVENISIISSAELYQQLTRVYLAYILLPDEEAIDSEPDEVIEEDTEELSDDELAILRDDELMCATQDFLTVLLSKEDYSDLFDCFEFDTCREVLMSICNMFRETYAIDIDWPLTERDIEGIEDD